MPPVSAQCLQQPNVIAAFGRLAMGHPKAGASFREDPAETTAGDRRNLVEVVYPGSIAAGDLCLLLFGAVD
jgi:hypothetical protein